MRSLTAGLCTWLRTGLLTCALGIVDVLGCCLEGCLDCLDGRVYVFHELILVNLFQTVES